MTVKEITEILTLAQKLNCEVTIVDDYESINTVNLNNWHITDYDELYFNDKCFIYVEDICEIRIRE